MNVAYHRLGYTSNRTKIDNRTVIARSPGDQTTWHKAGTILTVRRDTLPQDSLLKGHREAEAY